MDKQQTHAPQRASMARAQEIRRSGNGRLKKQIADWNQQHPVGTRVQLAHNGNIITATTSAPADRLHCDAVVWLRGYPGAFLLSICTVVGANHGN